MQARHPFLGKPPFILAHRGGAAEAPENTRRAFEHAADLGLTHVETDAHVSEDGVVVLSHDDAVDRTLNARGKIAHFPWRELVELKDPDGRAPMRLDEALTDFPTLRFNVDAKCDAVAEPLAHLARAHPGRILLASFSDRRLARMRAIAPREASSTGQAATAALVMLSRLEPSRALRLATRVPALRDAVAAQVPARFRGIPVVTARFVDLAHALNMQVHVWTVDEIDEMRTLLARGVDALVTDEPSRALAVLDEWGGAGC